jgi:hypothetical protein
MQMRCYRCGMSFAVKKEEVAFALAALEEAGGNHYDAQTEKGPISPDDDTQEPGAG